MCDSHTLSHCPPAREVPAELSERDVLPIPHPLDAQALLAAQEPNSVAAALTVDTDRFTRVQ